MPGCDGDGSHDSIRKRLMACPVMMQSSPPTNYIEKGRGRRNVKMMTKVETHDKIDQSSAIHSRNRYHDIACLK